jgi:hypothetical protein
MLAKGNSVFPTMPLFHLKCLTAGTLSSVSFFLGKKREEFCLAKTLWQGRDT